MENVVLYFPDTKSLSDFVISAGVSKAEASTKESSLIAPMEEEDVITAVTDFDARLSVEWPFKASHDC